MSTASANRSAPLSLISWEGEFNIGELCRMAYRDGAVHVGFGTDRGTVGAASNWDGPMEIKRLRPAREDSYEFAFRKTGMARCVADWRTRPRHSLVEALSQPMLERAIGVVYRPETEYSSHYFQAVLAEQFDAYVWFEETKAITPLPAKAYVHGFHGTSKR
jgi:erythromycin esterase-like protein